jgi:hypothetical protein
MKCLGYAALMLSGCAGCGLLGAYDGRELEPHDRGVDAASTCDDGALDPVTEACDDSPAGATGEPSQWFRRSRVCDEWTAWYTGSTGSQRS